MMNLHNAQYKPEFFVIGFRFATPYHSLSSSILKTFHPQFK